MTKTENEIIAEFMAAKKQYNDGQRAEYLLITAPKGFAGNWYEAGNLRYHESWDWLMPVVEKIAKMHSEKFHYDPVEIAKGVFPEDNNYMDVICLPVSTPISQVHKAVVDFIKTLTT